MVIQTIEVKEEMDLIMVWDGRHYRVAAIPNDKLPRIIHFTRKERQVIYYVSDGLTNKEIASILGMSEQTAKNHVAHIMRKLKAANRVKLVTVAIQAGLVKLPPLDILLDPPGRVGDWGEPLRLTQG